MQPIIDTTHPVYKPYRETYDLGYVEFDDTGGYIIHPPTYWTVSKLSHYQQRKRFPSVIPNFKSVVKSGQLLSPLPFYNHSQKHALRGAGSMAMYRTAIRGATEVQYLYGHNSGCMDMFGTPPDDPLLAELLAIAESEAITKLLNAAKDSKFNGAQAYAESAQLEKMLASAATKIVEVLTFIRKGQLRQAAAVLGLKVKRPQVRRHSQQHRRLKTNDDIDRFMANGILQVQYGIRPMLNDVVGAAELLAQKVTGFHLSKVVGSSLKRGNRTTKRTTEGSFARAVNTRSRYAAVLIKYGCSFTAENQGFHTLAQLGLTNPALLAWELLPWSFVIDWFIPIGNYLQSLDATLGLQFQHGYKITYITTDEKVISDLVPYNSRNFDTGRVTLTSDQATFERTVLTGWPSPRLPSFKNPVSWEHALNGIALLAGFRKTAYFS